MGFSIISRKQKSPISIFPSQNLREHETREKQVDNLIHMKMKDHKLVQTAAYAVECQSHQSENLKDEFCN